jgi:acyl dehydratase
MSLAPGDTIDLAITPDAYVTVRYAGASGDFNPIHVDEEFAKSVGLPARILHGLWMMAQVARAHTEAAGGPASLKRLSIQFRAPGMIGEELTVTGTVEGRTDDGERLLVSSEASQSGRKLIKDARAELLVAG